MIGCRYLDPGSVLSGRHVSPLSVVVLAKWGPGGGEPEQDAVVQWWRGKVPRSGPRNVLVQREDGTRQIVPFPRRLRRADR